MNKKIIINTRILVCLLLVNFTAAAQDSSSSQWWFNVELIVFKRALLPDNNENFGDALDINSADKYAKNISRFSNNLLYFSALKNTAWFTNMQNTLPLCQQISPLAAGIDEHLGLNLHSQQTMPSHLNHLLHNGNISELHIKLSTITSTLNRLASSKVSLSCLQQASSATLTQFILPNIGPRLFSDNSYFQGREQLLAQSDLVLEEFAKNIFAQRDISPLLYTAWRQEVEFGIENADFFRVRAGNLLETTPNKNDEKWRNTQQSSTAAQTLNNDVDFFDSLRQKLISNETVDWLEIEADKQPENTDFVSQKQYEIDGKIKVYLDYVNQIPYLHIDTVFNHFSVNIDDKGNSQLSAFPSKQLRRVISKQIHYFDHPAFGIIVRLERFVPPKTSEIDLDTDTTLAPQLTPDDNMASNPNTTDR